MESTREYVIYLKNNPETSSTHEALQTTSSSWIDVNEFSIEKWLAYCASLDRGEFMPSMAQSILANYRGMKEDGIPLNEQGEKYLEEWEVNAFTTAHSKEFRKKLFRWLWMIPGGLLGLYLDQIVSFINDVLLVGVDLFEGVSIADKSCTVVVKLSKPGVIRFEYTTGGKRKHVLYYIALGFFESNVEGKELCYGQPKKFSEVLTWVCNTLHPLPMKVGYVSQSSSSTPMDND